MRAFVGSNLPALLRGPVLRYAVTVSAWRDGFLELPSVPVVGGRVRWSGSLLESAEVSLTVPATPEHIPDGPYHPLASFGQEVVLAVEVAGPDETVRVPLGRFRLEGEPRRVGNELELSARDLGVNIERARLITPTAYGYLSSANPDEGRRSYLQNLVRVIAPVWIDAPDAPLDALMTPMRDRLDALQQMLEAWPARARFDVSGALYVYPEPDPARPAVLTLTDGEGGTVVRVDTTPAPSRLYNACIASGQDANGGTVIGGAYLRTGPMAWPNTDPAAQYGMSPGFYYSPLLRSVPQCVAAARSILARWQRGVAGTVAVECGPDPRIEVGDVIEVVKDGSTYRLEVTGVDLPLTAEEGPMQIEGAIL